MLLQRSFLLLVQLTLLHVALGVVCTHTKLYAKWENLNLRTAPEQALILQYLSNIRPTQNCVQVTCVLQLASIYPPACIELNTYTETSEIV